MEGEDEKKGIVQENIDCDESVDHLVGYGKNGCGRKEKMIP